MSEEYITLSLDTEKLHAAVHNLPNFNSYCESDGIVYAAGVDGIYKLIGNTDDGKDISTGVEWQSHNFGTNMKKRVRFAIVEGVVDNAKIQAETETGKHVYNIKNSRAAFGRDLIGRNWRLGVADFDVLESIDLTLVLARR